MKYTRSEIKKFIKENYGISASGLKRLPDGLMNFNYLVQSDRRQYVFRINNLRSLKDVAFTAGVLRALAAKKFPSPCLIESQDKKPVLSIKGKPCLLYKYIEGKSWPRLNNNLLKQAGFLLGKMHKSLQSFKPAAAKLTWDPEELKIIMSHNRNRMIKSKFKGARELMDFMETELAKFYFPENLPKGITHQDVKPENIIISGGKIKGILDFDNGYRGVLLHDLTTPIIWTCFKNNKLDYKLLNSYLSGYSQNRKLSIVERKYLLEGIRFRLLREAFIGPFAIYPYPEKSKERSDHFIKLYKKTEALEEKDFRVQYIKLKDQD